MIEERRPEAPPREAGEQQPQREPAHAEASREERFETSQPEVASPPAAAGRAAHVEFHAVSQHDEQEDAGAAHRPPRRRRTGASATESAQAPLQLVETQAEAAPPVQDEDLPRRTRPRRRRSVAVESEPLQLVETESPPAGDNPPSP